MKKVVHEELTKMLYNKEVRKPLTLSEYHRNVNAILNKHKAILKAHDASLRQSLVKEVVDKIEAELCAYTPSGTKFYPIKNLEEWNKLKLKIILQEKE